MHRKDKLFDLAHPSTSSSSESDDSVSDSELEDSVSELELLSVQSSSDSISDASERLGLSTTPEHNQELLTLRQNGTMSFHVF